MQLNLLKTTTIICENLIISEINVYIVKNTTTRKGNTFYIIRIQVNIIKIFKLNA